MKNHSIGEFEELVLLSVAALHDQAYGVSIQESLAEKLSKKINISAVHVALKRMEGKGFVKSRFGGITEERGGRRKKYYVITAIGKQVLDGQYELRTTLYKMIPKISFGTMNAKPPKWPLLFLRWFCREDYLDEIEGDLVEIFHRHPGSAGKRAGSFFGT